MQVEPELSMRAAHAIGERVRHTLVRDFPLLTEAQIHIGNSSDSPLQCGSVEVWKCGSVGGTVSSARSGLQILPISTTAPLLSLSQKARRRRRRRRGVPIQCLCEAEKRWQAGKVEKVNLKFDAEM